MGRWIYDLSGWDVVGSVLRSLEEAACETSIGKSSAMTVRLSYDLKMDQACIEKEVVVQKLLTLSAVGFLSL